MPATRARDTSRRDSAVLVMEPRQSRLVELRSTVAQYPASVQEYPQLATNTSGTRTVGDQLLLRTKPWFDTLPIQIDREAQNTSKSAQELLQVSEKLRLLAINLRNQISAAIMILPEEVLQNIFLFGPCLLYDSDMGDSIEWALLVSSVCKKWRGVALETRTLWCILAAHWSLSCQETWLQRAGPSPKGLAIYLEFKQNRFVEEARRIMRSNPFTPNNLDEHGVFAHQSAWERVGCHLWPICETILNAEYFMHRWCVGVAVLTILPLWSKDLDLNDTFGTAINRIFDAQRAQISRHSPKELIIVEPNSQ